MTRRKNDTQDKDTRPDGELPEEFRGDPHESGGTVGATVYQEPVEPLNVSDEDLDKTQPGPVDPALEKLIRPADEPGGTVGAPVHEEPVEPVATSQPEANRAELDDR